MQQIFGNNPGHVTDAVAAFANRQSPLVAGTYRDLIIEERAYREEGKSDKALLTYDASLERVQAAGFERHLRPGEAFGLLIDGLEGKLTRQNKAIYYDMVTGYGEWLSLAIERKGYVLVAYLDPVGLQWNARAKNYEVQGTLSYTQRKEYDISGKLSDKFIDLNKFSPDFVQDMYGKHFVALPEEMRVGNQRAQVYLPPEGNIWPVGHGYLRFNINYFGNYGASRGGRLASKNLHRK